MEGDTLQVVYDFADSLEENECVQYALVVTYPRQELGGEKLQMTLKECGLAPQAALFVQPGS